MLDDLHSHFKNIPDEEENKLPPRRHSLKKLFSPFVVLRNLKIAFLG